MNLRRRATFVAVSSLLLAACRNLDVGPAGAHRSPGRGPQLRPLVEPSPVAPVAPVQDPLATIARFEDARSDGDGLLQVLLAQGADATRERAATALGRLPYPERKSEVTRVLVRALGDSVARVRAAAAFAVGERGDPAAIDGVRGRLGVEKDELVKARLVEAASRLLAVEDDPELRWLVLAALTSPSEAVRVEAAVAPSRWKSDAKDAAQVDDALIAAVKRGLLVATAANLADPPLDAEPAWRALFSLARRKCVIARPVFVTAIDAADVRSRIFGAMGLGAIAHDGASQAALYRALDDDDERVVVEALRAIGAHPDAETPARLEAALKHRSPHVQRVAFEAWGNLPKGQRGERSLTSRALLFESVDVRNAAFVAAAKLEGDDASASIELRAGDKEPLARMSAAEAAQHLSPARGTPILIRLAADDDVRVVEAACEGLGKLDDDGVHPKLVELLASGDNGVRLAAIEALKEHPRPSDVASLARCFASSQGEIADEIAFNALAVVAKIAAGAKGEDTIDRTTRDAATELFERALAHPNPYVRRRARELFAETWPDRRVPSVAPPRPERAAFVPLPGIDYALGVRPRVRVETSRGAMTFELFQDETPVHVWSFLELAKRAFYDGTTFHRVVPDFVVQGGDRRADGNGGSSWRGDSLRAEFTPRKFVRGSLGMPRNDDVESGGSQIFVCHRETPHLDGRYTLFGQLVDGFDVLDRLEVGDAIVSVRRIDGAGTR